MNHFIASGFACPGCSKPMKGGFVTAGKGLKFRDNGRFRLTIFGGIPIIGMWTSRGVPAWHCEACGLVVLRQEGRGFDEGDRGTLGRNG